MVEQEIRRRGNGVVPLLVNRHNPRPGSSQRILQLGLEFLRLRLLRPQLLQILRADRACPPRATDTTLDATGHTKFPCWCGIASHG